MTGGWGSPRAGRFFTLSAMKKSCAVGCAVLLILAAALVGVLMTKGPQWFAQGKGFVMNVMAEEARIGAFEAAWIPPSPEPDGAWAPGTIGQWKLKQHEAVTGWPELNITRGGQRMIYENGSATIEIGVVAANELEKEALLKRVLDAAKDAGNTTTRKSIGNGTVTLNSGAGNMTTTMGNRTHVKSGNHHTRVWWLKDWLFFFRGQDVDPDLGEEYLKAISGSPAVAEPGTPPKVETEPQ